MQNIVSMQYVNSLKVTYTMNIGKVGKTLFQSR